jgi:deoxyuridine 5'-triphosphate nucleotidohydrolase
MQSIETVYFRLLSVGARAPVRGSAAAAGFDLFALVDGAEMTIAPGCHALVPTGVAIALPAGTYGCVCARSGLAHKFAIGVGAGVIDGDYRGPLGVILFNHGSGPFTVRSGDRIAQLVIERYSPAVAVVVDELPSPADLGHAVPASGESRDARGFGSTGV